MKSSVVNQLILQIFLLFVSPWNAHAQPSTELHYGPRDAPVSASEAQAIEGQIQSGTERRFGRPSAEYQDYQRQQMQRAVEQNNARDQVFRRMDEKLRNAKAQILSSNIQIMRMLGQLAAGLRTSPPEENIPARSDNVAQNNLALDLTESGREYYSDQVNKATETKDWDGLVDSATQLFNAWTGLTFNPGTYSALDSYGIVKGPLLSPNSFNPNSVSRVDKNLSQRLRKIINTLQGLTSKEFYYLDIPQTRAALKASALLAKLAGDTNDPRYAEISESILGEFLGIQVGGTYSINSGKFVSSTLADVSSGKTPREIAQAVYSELVNAPSWILSSDSQASLVLAERSYGTAINLEASAAEYIQNSIGELERSEWSHLSEEVSLKIRENMTFQNAEVSDAYQVVNQHSVIGVGDNAQEAYDGSITYFQIADQIFSDGDRESAAEFLNYAAMMADIAIGFIPVANVINDAYVLVTGKTLFIGEEVGDTGRIVSLVSLLTGGLAGEANRIKNITSSIHKCCLSKGLNKALDTLQRIGAWTKEGLEDFARWLKKPLHPNLERGAIGEGRDKALDLIRGLRPEKAVLDGADLFEKVPRNLRGNVWDIMENLPNALKGDKKALDFINKLEPHELTRDLKGWTSLDLVPNNRNTSPLRFLYKKDANGEIRWLLKDTHK